MASWEGFRIWNYAYKRNLPTLLEIHGDAQETILLQNYSSLFARMARKPYASWIHNRLTKMSQDTNVLVCWGDALARKYAGKRDHFLRVPHHLTKADFFKRKSYRDEGPYSLLFIGPLQARKGVHYLIDALGILRKERDIPVSLDIVGDGPDRIALEAQTRKLHLDNFIRFHGQLPFGGKIMEFYRSADLFVLPSISSDTVNRSIRELKLELSEHPE